MARPIIYSVFHAGGVQGYFPARVRGIFLSTSLGKNAVDRNYKSRLGSCDAHGGNSRDDSEILSRCAASAHGDGSLLAAGVLLAGCVEMAD